jgi:hypothetical protein
LVTLFVFDADEIEESSVESGCSELIKHCTSKSKDLLIQFCIGHFNWSQAVSITESPKRSVLNVNFFKNETRGNNPELTLFLEVELVSNIVMLTIFAKVSYT